MLAECASPDEFLKTCIAKTYYLQSDIIKKVNTGEHCINTNESYDVRNDPERHTNHDPFGLIFSPEPKTQTVHYSHVSVHKVGRYQIIHKLLETNTFPENN